MTRPEFKLCGRFNGKESAACWLKRFEYELGDAPPAQYLQLIDILLTGDAAAWAESDGEASELLNTETPTADTVTTFKTHFILKFPSIFQDPAPVSFNSELSELKQHLNKFILLYYNYVLSMVLKFSMCDCLNQYQLSAIKAAMLSTVVWAFIWRLYNSDVH